MKLLLHCCCAPCSIQCVQALVEEGIRPDLFWYNPNIHPFTEFRSRLDALKTFADEQKLPLIVNENYGLRSFIRETFPFVDKPYQETRERCCLCYEIRLKQSALVAVKMGYDAFSTTLLISPFQNHDEILKAGEKIAAAHGLAFVYRDFRPRFRESQSQARASSYYMQKYCGCIFSEEERYLGSCGAGDKK